jgi:hypothetical protein
LLGIFRLPILGLMQGISEPFRKRLLLALSFYPSTISTVKLIRKKIDFLQGKEPFLVPPKHQKMVR